jgi:hypothetical protein
MSIFFIDVGPPHLPIPEKRIYGQESDIFSILLIVRYFSKSFFKILGFFPLKLACQAYSPDSNPGACTPHIFQKKCVETTIKIGILLMY